MIAAVSALFPALADGQVLPPHGSRDVVVGIPKGASPMDRSNAGRTGLTMTELPASALRVDFRVAFDAPLARAPVVDGNGTIYVVDARGEARAIRADGTEAWRFATSGADPSPLALLADGTIVFVSARGDAVGVRNGTLRFRAHVGRAGTRSPAPLPLEDGGVAVATAFDLVILDPEGQTRSRTIAEEAITSPLIAAGGRIVFVSASGSVWAWSMGAEAPTRIATFGSPLDSAPVLANDHTLIAVHGLRRHLSAVDLVRGTSTLRATALDGTFRGPPTVRGESVYLLLATAASDAAVVYDTVGTETLRSIFNAHTPVGSADAGAALPAAAFETWGMVDPRGTFVFATPRGDLASLSSEGDGRTAVEVFSDPCQSQETDRHGAAAEPPIAGLAPLSLHRFVATCRAGALIALRGGGGGGRGK